MTEQPEKFKARIVFLVPVLASLLFGMLCATLLLKPTPSSPPAVAITPISQTTPAGPAFNAFYFVIIIAVGATLMYFLIKYRSRRTLSYLTGFALSAAFMLLGFVYFSAILSKVPNYLLIVSALSILLTVLADLVIFRFGGKVSGAVVLGLGGALGVFLGANLYVYTSALILVFLAVFDIYAVYRGPIGKIAEGGLEQLKGLSFSFKSIEMGLGDLVFYSLLAGTMFINYSLTACLFSVAGILAGSYLTFLALERREVFPGLPFPICLGLVLGLLAGLFL